MPEKIHLKKFLIFCLITRIWGTLSAAMQNPEAPKGVCQCHCIKHEITPGHQAPVRPPPQPGSRKFRSSYCSEAEQKKEKVSPPGVRAASPFSPIQSHTRKKFLRLASRQPPRAIPHQEISHCRIQLDSFTARPYNILVL